MDLEKRLYISCLAGLSGLQKLALSLTDMTVSELMGFSQVSFSSFLVDNHIVGQDTLSKTPIDFDRKHLPEKVGILERWSRLAGHHVIFLGDEGYPGYLSMGYAPPYRICYTGTLPLDSAPTLSVAGTRTPTGTAVCECYRFGLDGALNHTQIVSSLSAGCDQACHQGCVDAGGGAWVILPCGTEYPYPSCPKLRRQIVERGGGLLSPFLPDEIPYRWNLLYRNELLGAFSPWLVAFQGGSTSGVLLCVDSALRQGRDVAVLRCGAVDAPASRGTYTLMMDGAPVVDGFADFAHISRGLYDCRRSVEKVTSKDDSLTLWSQAKRSGTLYHYRNAWYTA